jgi:hypothetical protein
MATTCIYDAGHMSLTLPNTIRRPPQRFVDLSHELRLLSPIDIHEILLLARPHIRCVFKYLAQDTTAEFWTVASNFLGGLVV